MVMAHIRYVGTGRKSPEITITVSMDRGRNWRKQTLKSGQTYNIPPTVTDLRIDNVPYDPKLKYVVRDGNVAQE